MRLGPILAAAALVTLAAACSKPQESASPPDTASAPAAPAAPELSDADKQAILASYPAPYNTADLANGKAKFALCQSCHTIAPGGANMTGPNLHGVFGKKSASNPDFKYSDALKNAGWVWDASHLDQWLEKPMTFLPGTKMSFAGLKDAKDRTDLIGYLMVETGHKAQ
ncbi:MAG: cytochrome c family protein [Phenylobacterium sp.]|uniref:c-type cytochrome n=1 Tax=Phenylobacterium sp. TaxID=1871053 RepID=UPI001208B506|nr:cytochrome c family protein [Phenylobacterium sp.]TAJ69739.1 MAG: cytochrome c family protein [Phenylobacterium sp.]